MNIKRLAGFQPVQVDCGWILRRTAPADQSTLFGVPVTEMPANRLELAAKAGNPQIKAVATAELGRRNAAISPDQD
jgi:hypothetical protein